MPKGHDWVVHVTSSGSKAIDLAMVTARTDAGYLDPVQGYGGVVEMPPGYLSGAAERVCAAGGLYIADEVQSGFGRTGDHMWGFEADGVVPGVVVIAKGIGNGFPLAAVVAKRPSAT